MPSLPGLDVGEAWARFKKQGDQAAREALVLRYAYLVNITAGRLVANPPPNLEREDLVSAGILGLIKAVDQFDPARNVKFETYAIALIRGAILETLREEDWVPRSVRDRAKQIEKAMSSLEARLGRPATESEIARELNIGLDEYHRLLSDTARAGILSLEETVLGGEGGESVVTLAETIADESADIYQAVERSERIRLLAQAVDRLPPRERTVIALYYREGLTFREIGRALSISESRAYQLHSQAILRMRTYLESQAVMFGAETPNNNA
ncbi:MAG: FliA/WhiG family RNA polymerase sigma factor [Armatimonadota bacterium]